jgi:hypothetical protein
MWRRRSTERINVNTGKKTSLTATPKPALLCFPVFTIGQKRTTLQIGNIHPGQDGLRPQVSGINAHLVLSRQTRGAFETIWVETSAADSTKKRCTGILPYVLCTRQQLARFYLT